MGFKVLKKAFLSFDGQNLSSYIKSITLTYETATADDTTMGDDTMSNIATMKNWSISITFLSDVDVSGLDSILYPRLGGDAKVVIVRPDSGSVSTSNPNFTSNGIMTSYVPFGGSVGELSTSPVTILPSKGSGSSDLVRTTS